MRLHSPETIAHYRDQRLWGDDTLLEIAFRNAAENPEQVAIIDPPNRPEIVGGMCRTLNWKNVNDTAEVIAGELREKGVQHDDIVLVQLPNVWELIVLYIAICKTGAIISPIPVQWRGKEFRYVADLTDARLFIGTRNYKGSDLIAEVVGDYADEIDIIELQEISKSLTTVDSSKVTRSTEGRMDADDIFTLCWTSGTEREPKGCPLSHNNWIFQSGLICDFAGIPKHGRILATAPIVNMTGVSVVVVPWILLCGTIVLHHPLDMDLLLQQLSEQDIDFTILVPALLNRILDHPGVNDLSFEGVKSILTGSAPPSQFSLDEFKRRWGIEIVNLWGQNEGTLLGAGPSDVPDSAMRVDHFPWWEASGTRWPSSVRGVDIDVRDTNGASLTEPGSVGVLYYRGPNLFPGYFERPDLNDECFTVDGYFRTGDIFEILEGGYLSFYDREKDIVIRGGMNVSAAEVESVVIAHPSIADVAVIAMPDSIMGERICAVVVCRDGAPKVALDELVEFMKSEGLSLYKLPEIIRYVDEIPRNPVGKIIKGRLREAFFAGGDSR